MTDTARPEQVHDHKTIAIDLFNRVWTLLERMDRTCDEDDLMIHAAHASRYHWGQVGNATNLSVGEWQISRVYSTLQRPEPARYHGRRSLQIATENALAPFYIGYGYEALARAEALDGATDLSFQYLRQAQELLNEIDEEEERELLEADLSAIAKLVPNPASSH